MWSAENLLKEIKTQKRIDQFKDLYGSYGQSVNLNRILDLLSRNEISATHLFSAPGRTELGGNHTDHNSGKVLCAAVQNDTLAAVSRRSDGIIEINSEGFDERLTMSITDLRPRASEQGKSLALIRGVLAGIDQMGGQLGGFSAEITSNVRVGSGLSSSASFEVLIGTIINDLYNDGQIPPEKIAQIGQFAENAYFGKPCGLMDQTISAIGGILEIDFADPTHIDIKNITFDLKATDYVLCVVNTGSSHADLTSDYAGIPGEMKAVASLMGTEVLRGLSESVFRQNLNSLRSKLGDRAVLRALHFYSENNRVDEMVAALQTGDFESYLNKVAASGASSQNLLQNIVPLKSDGKEQGLALALGMSQLFLEERGRGVTRVHGGGFAGTIQAYVHEQDYPEYHTHMCGLLGDGAVELLTVRNQGAGLILQL